jgi:hypothetical protein
MPTVSIVQRISLSCDKEMLADAVAILHAFIPLSILGMTFAGKAQHAWTVVLAVLVIYLNWELDPERKCVLTRLEANLRDEEMDEFGGFLWNHLGKPFGIPFKKFDRAVNALFLVVAMVALFRYRHFCTSRHK